MPTLTIVLTAEALPWSAPSAVLAQQQQDLLGRLAPPFEAVTLTPVFPGRLEDPKLRRLFTAHTGDDGHALLAHLQGQPWVARAYIAPSRGCR